MLLLLLAIVGSIFASGAINAGALPVRQVYTLTNQPAGNGVAVFDRLDDGQLVYNTTVPTGGLGTGSGLGSLGALISSSDGRHLYAVDAGSDEISVLEITGGGLVLIDTVPSGGTTPVSLTLRGRNLYVLNQGGTGNITGFKVKTDGTLAMRPGSTRPLSGPAAGAAQISFSPNGKTLVVTEKATNLITTYQVIGKVTTGPTSYPSSGQTPFGFAFSQRGYIVVSEAFGGAPDASALSSYDVNLAGVPEVITATAPTTETAACWVVITKSQRYTYTTNTGSNSVTGFALHASGKLSLLNPDGVTATTGAAPTDLTMTKGGQLLYVLNSGDGSVSGYAANPDGSLTPINTAGGLPAGTVGLAVR